MYKVKKIVSCFIFCALIFSLCACGKERKTGSTDNEVYEETIGRIIKSPNAGREKFVIFCRSIWLYKVDRI